MEETSLLQSGTPGENSAYEFPWRDPQFWDISADHDRILNLPGIISGTWMALDLSPDGQTIVFDLLGDLYTLPITGGWLTTILRCFINFGT
jgi:hypothetical protein